MQTGPRAPRRSVAALPDGSGFVSGSADHDVKFWEWEVAADPETGAKQLGISHTRCAGAGPGRMRKGLLGGGGVLRLSLGLGWRLAGRRWPCKDGSLACSCFNRTCASPLAAAATPTCMHIQHAGAPPHPTRTLT